MSTSGTIGSTVITTNKLLEKSLRRCGLVPSTLTPETVESALESTYLFLLSLANRGLNLWCINRSLIPLGVGRKTYPLPTGTLDVLNVLHATPTRVTGTQSSPSAQILQDLLSTSSRVVRFGVKFSSTPTSFQLEKSDNGGLSWGLVLAPSEMPPAGSWGWYDLDPMVEGSLFRVVTSSPATPQELFLCSEVREIPVAQFNRDDYANQPAKNQQSSVATNYYFEKLIDPQLTLWPVPNDDTRQLVIYYHRQVQDVGSLSQSLEIPPRWLEAVSWHLAARLAFEVPNVDAARRQEVLQMASTMTLEVEAGETDGAPIFISPAIRVYTR